MDSLNVDIGAAAELVGVSARTLKRMLAADQLPPGVAVKVRGRRLFVRQALADWVRAGCPVREPARKRGR